MNAMRRMRMEPPNAADLGLCRREIPRSLTCLHIQYARKASVSRTPPSVRGPFVRRNGKPMRWTAMRSRSADSKQRVMTVAFNGLPSLPLLVFGDRHLLLFP